MPFRLLLLLSTLLSSYSCLLLFLFFIHLIDFLFSLVITSRPAFHSAIISWNFLLTFFLFCFFFLHILSWSYFQKILYIWHILLIFHLCFFSIWCWLCFLFSCHILPPLSTLFFTHSAVIEIFVVLLSFGLPMMCSFRIFTRSNSMYFSSLFLVVFSFILSFFSFVGFFKYLFLDL